MLEEVLRYINNRFERSSIEGHFEIEGGTMEVDGALEGQYVWLEGSVLNDGLHLYPLDGLADEEFDGAVWLLAVPSAVIDIADEIEAWRTANADALSGPYQSESFGGYSYSLSAASAGNGAPLDAWHAKFGARLLPYRKLSRDWV